MDESFQDSITISELFKPSILKLEEIYMPYPTNFGSEFTEIKHSENDDFQSSPSQTNINSIQPTNLIYEKNYSSHEYKTTSTQFSDFQSNLNDITPFQNIQVENDFVAHDKCEQTKQQELENNPITIDEFAKLFSPVVSESLDFLSPEDVNSLINKMFHQSQQYLNENQS